MTIWARAVVTALGFWALAGTAAIATQPVDYAIPKQSDYTALTGCKGGDYAESMKDAMRFLAFGDLDTGNPNNNDIYYARRHTRGFFQELMSNHPLADGTLDPGCLTPALRNILLALRMLDATGRYTDDHAGIDHVYGPEVPPASPPETEAYIALPRAVFMERTGCLVSPASYNKYRTGYEYVVMEYGLQDYGKEQMAGFLDDLADSRPTPDGFADPSCLIDPVARIAREFGLLDDQGRYRRR